MWTVVCVNSSHWVNSWNQRCKHQIILRQSRGKQIYSWCYQEQISYSNIIVEMLDGSVCHPNTLDCSARYPAVILIHIRPRSVSLWKSYCQCVTRVLNLRLEDCFLYNHVLTLCFVFMKFGLYLDLKFGLGLNWADRALDLHCNAMLWLWIPKSWTRL